ncbi:ATP-binding protein [Candidatus Kaiserbacteria bacterium]|nr:ATP-binding protein [Candidatus Kaiserbacteria bacterium]
MNSIVYLLCGLPGSGKTTYAKNLEKEGITRLTLDETLFERFGREYTDGHKEKQKQTKDELKELVVKRVKTGQSVIVDFGFWRKAERNAYKSLIESLGGEWRLLYFKVGKDVLIERLASRNVTDPQDNHIIDEALLEKFITEFEEPINEGEEVIG